MSLTSEISNKESKISLFFTKNFNFNSFLTETNNDIKNSYTITPKQKQNYPWSSVGHMVEYLMLIHMGLKINDLFPLKYVQNIFPKYLEHVEKKYKNTNDFFKNKDLFKELCDDLYRMAVIESIIRGGEKISVEKIFKIEVDNNIFKDIIEIYFKSIKENKIINDKNNYFCYNPTFDLSMAIGGADADLYLIKPKGNLLIDLKTTVRPQVTEEMMFQLLGYVFLDESNKHNFQEIGIYLTRQNLISNWNIEELIIKNSRYKNKEIAKIDFKQAIQEQLLNKFKNNFNI